MTTLTITSGDHAADLLGAAGHPGPILPWRDALHEGPVVEAPSLEALSLQRAEHLAELFRLDRDTVAATFAERDEAMRRHDEFETVELWFEHDLYDQLQLLQILDFFAREGRTEGIYLIQADSYLAHERPDTVLRFARGRRAVTELTLSEAMAAWDAFRSPTPERIAAQLPHIDTLPFLAPAFARLLEELPDPDTGLGRTEAIMLDVLARHPEPNPSRLFDGMRNAEPAAFMGDWPFYSLLDKLAFCDFPLVEGLGRRYSHGEPQEHHDYIGRPLRLSMMGEDVRTGAQDNVSANGIDRWWGGTHLSGFRAWRFDRKERRLLQPD